MSAITEQIQLGNELELKTRLKATWMTGDYDRFSRYMERGAEQFYQRLLAALRQPVVREGQWQLLECTPAWDGNWTSDCFLVFAWRGPADERLLVTVNYAPNQSQCNVRMPFAELSKSHWRLQDLISDAIYDWEGDDLQARGLYLDESPWQARIFSLTKRL
jgi:hypothetical protein